MKSDYKLGLSQRNRPRACCAQTFARLRKRLRGVVPSGRVHRHGCDLYPEEGEAGDYTCVHSHTPGEAKTAANARPCLECHEEDTGWAAESDDPMADLVWAVSYLEVMHGTCMECHEKEALEQDRPELRDCSTCHQSLAPGGVGIQVLAGGGTGL